MLGKFVFVLFLIITSTAAIGGGGGGGRGRGGDGGSGGGGGRVSGDVGSRWTWTWRHSWFSSNCDLLHDLAILAVIKSPWFNNHCDQISNLQLLIYAGSFFVIPLFRRFVLLKTNADIEKRNPSRQQFARHIELPDLLLR